MSSNQHHKKVEEKKEEIIKELKAVSEKPGNSMKFGQEIIGDDRRKLKDIIQKLYGYNNKNVPEGMVNALANPNHDNHANFMNDLSKYLNEEFAQRKGYDIATKFGKSNSDLATLGLLFKFVADTMLDGLKQDKEVKEPAKVWFDKMQEVKEDLSISHKQLKEGIYR